MEMASIAALFIYVKIYVIDQLNCFLCVCARANFKKSNSVFGVVVWKAALKDEWGLEFEVGRHVV